MPPTPKRSCAIHQPNSFPRLSTLAKLLRADVWVVLDDVQFNSRDYQHRARLAALEDPLCQQWLSLPVHRPRGRASRIDELRLAEPETGRRRVAQLIRQFYGRAPFWRETSAAVDEVLAALALTDRLSEVAEVSTRALLAGLGWRGEVVRSSEVPSSDQRSERLADLTAAVGAGTYLCGRGGAKYLDEAPFTARGIAVDYPHPPALCGKDGMRTASALWAYATLGPEELSCELTPVPVPA
ncbi:WbqC family protein [Amycolatopsis acidicola]|uniref:WbqC family protein n=1 Tax=Amycolatopsis acidicola TaxID=2596893 RepID=UPI001FB716D4|nr:WbqC family protein [Amycolatopsis acidicola]